MIGIIACNDLGLCPFILHYTRILDRHQVPYEVIYWQRKAESDEKAFAGPTFPLVWPMDNRAHPLQKIGGFMAFACYGTGLILGRKYKRLIVLTTQAGLSLFPLLLGAYAGRYVLDYRDVTREAHSPLYRRLVGRLAQASAFTAVSSPGFKPVFQGVRGVELVLAHNMAVPRPMGQTRAKRMEGPLRLVYWGMVRQFAYLRGLCDALGNDPRFELAIRGEGDTARLHAHCQGRGYRNITFSGRYAPSEVAGFAQACDILLNTYDNDVQQQPALTVKLYDGLLYGLPMLVNKGGLMARYVSPYGFALALGQDEGQADRVYHWYAGLDMAAVAQGYRSFYGAIQPDIRRFEERVMAFAAEGEALP